MTRTVLVVCLAMLAAGAASAGAGGPIPSAESPAGQLRQEIERLRREAEEQRRQQEERIRALEQKLEKLEKREQEAAGAPPPVTTRPGIRARLYGFARADLNLDSRKLFAHPHLPFWALSPEDPRAGNAADGAFTLHPRLTRLGLDTDAGTLRSLGGGRLTGKIEVDFFNFVPGNPSATSNSRQFPRIRHAYGQLDQGSRRFLFGQTWDLISPLFPAVNPDVLMWNAGNLGDRRPQFRATWETPVRKGRASLAVAALSAGAVDGANRDALLTGDFVLDGEQSGRPLWQFRTALSQPSWAKGQNWELGFWGHQGEYRWDRANAIAGRRSISSSALGMDLRLPLTARLALQGEGWFGSGLADVRGGVGQSISPTGRPVHSRGGWAELSYLLNARHTVAGGFSLDNPDDREVTPFTGANGASVGRTLNRTYYLSNRWNLGSGLAVGLDWMLFETFFRGLAPGSANRWNFWVMHGF